MWTALKSKKAFWLPIAIALAIFAGLLLISEGTLLDHFKYDRF